MNTLVFAIKAAAHNVRIALYWSIGTLIACVVLFMSFYNYLQYIFDDNSIALLVKFALICGMALICSVCWVISSFVFWDTVRDEFKAQSAHANKVTRRRLGFLAKQWEASQSKATDGRIEYLALSDELTLLHFKAGYSLAKLEQILLDENYNFHLYLAKDPSGTTSVRFGTAL